MGSKKTINIAIVIILFAATILRLISLNQSLWLDEATSAVLARDFSYQQIINDFMPGDFHPPLYYLLLKVWGTVSGYSEVGLRIFSVFSGVVSIYLVYLLTKKITKNNNVSLLVSSLLATSGLHIYYSQEARMYVLQTLFVILSFLFFTYIVDGKKKNNENVFWVGFSISILFIGMTDYLPLLVLPVFWMYAVYKRKSRDWWYKFVIAHIPLLIFFVLWYPTFLHQVGIGRRVQDAAPVWWSVLGRTDLKNTLLIPVKFVLGRIGFTDKYLYTGVVIVSLSLYLIAIMRSLKNFKKELLIWLWLFVPLILAFILGLFLSVFSYFRLIFVLPALYIIVASGISIFRKKRARIIYASILLILNLVFTGYYLFNSQFHREDWRSLVGYIETQEKRDEAIVLFVAPSQMEVYNYYAPNAKIAGPGGFNDTYEKIYLMRYVQPIFDSDDKLRTIIEENDYIKGKELDFNQVVVWEYNKKL